MRGGDVYKFVLLCMAASFQLQAGLAEQVRSACCRALEERDPPDDFYEVTEGDLLKAQAGLARAKAKAEGGGALMTKQVQLARMAGRPFPTPPSLKALRCMGRAFQIYLDFPSPTPAVLAPHQPKSAPCTPCPAPSTPWRVPAQALHAGATEPSRTE